MGLSRTDDEPSAARGCRIDEPAFGSLACRHLQEKGYGRLAYLTPTKAAQHHHRVGGFIEACEQVGITVETALPKNAQELLNVMQAVPRPLGVFCATDGHAAWLRDTLSAAGYSVPKDVAIVGCGDTPRFVLAREPELSSVAYPWFAIGQATGRCLHHLIQGNPERMEPEFLRPLRVIPRASTAAVQVRDPLVSKAVARLRRHPHSSRPLAEVAEALETSPHTICRHFKAVRGSSPKAVHQQLRLSTAKELLCDQRLSIADIAIRCGFASSTAFGVAFKRAYACTPGEFRTDLLSGR